MTTTLPTMGSIPAGQHDPVKLPAAGLAADEWERLSALAAGAVSPATRRAYRSDWRRWRAWCDSRGATPLPADPSLVAVFLEQHASAVGADGGFRFAPSSLSRWVAALNQVCRAAGYAPPGQHPAVRAVLSAIRRGRGQPPKRRDPLLLDDLARITRHVRTSAGRLRAGRIAAHRDVALLTAGFFGGFRRSELSGLTLADVGYHGGDGLHVRVRRSKTDQEAAGQVKALPFTTDPGICPVCAMVCWLEIVHGFDGGGRAGIMRILRGRDHDPDTDGHVCRPDHPAIAGHRDGAGPVFRPLHRSGLLRDRPLSGQSINTMIGRRARDAGLNPGRDLGGHSLRAGLVTEAYRAGASAEEIARQTGHTSLTVLAGYRREYAPLAGNAVTRLAGSG